ncbi:microfibril-associated glycoprotein 4-like [Anopheles maculipalpis]|uniref:microfibril-associated glycoprotein 4-like n=1 Tax=Anopheles maculipalpis TaxID=1496333 RepID=UPI0021598A64|nr:microfibril-associated glycoprotein 4-like [Anopheles maculipalpis]
MKTTVVLVLICCHTVLCFCSVRANDTTNDVEPFQGLKTNLMLQVLKRLDEIDQRISHLERRIQSNHHITTAFIRDKLDGINDKLESINKTLRQNVGTYYASCQEAPAMLSDVYTIKPPASSVAPFRVYCEQSYRQGGWIVISRRFDGSLNFTRDWIDYRDGFGTPEGEYWLGLEKMHRITGADYFQLLVHLKDYEGTVKTALYDEFEIGNESSGYRLHLGAFVEGNAKDSLRPSVGMKFSTPDRDNDEHPGSCADYYASGWWFRNCMNANLNGVYRRLDPRNATMNWFGFRDDLQGLKEATMMIREVSS